MKRSSMLLNKKIQKLPVDVRKSFIESVNRFIKEGSLSNSDSINQLSDQIKKFIVKYKNNPNSAINSLAIGMFLGFSEAFSEDGNDDTNGINMLQRTVEKLRTLMKEYEGLVPEEGEDFDLEDDDIEDMETTLDDEIEGEVDDEYRNGEVDELDNLEVDDEDDEEDEEI